MTRLILRTAPIVLACALALAGCHDAAKGVGAQSAESHAPGTTMAVVPGSCASYPKGAPGVINAFCKGPAKVTVSIDGKPPHSLTGGTCGHRSNGDFTLNLGVLGTHDLAGPRPDYVGLKAPVGQGPFESGALVVNVDGKSYIVTTNHGAVGPTGTFAGVTRRGHKVQGDFTC